MKSKRGQTHHSMGSLAATFISIMVLLIILYILLLPPNTRQEILLGNETTSGTGSSNATTNVSTQALLLEHPGKLEFLAKDEIDHSITTVNLFSTTESQILKKIDSAFVSNSWFSEKTSTFNFSIKDLPNTNNAVLSFNVLNKKGNLIVKFNGKEILNRETDPNVALNLPPEILREENQIEFAVSGVGAAFWRTNGYTLQGIKVTADVTTIDTLKSKSVFYITATEKNTVEISSLKFFLNCGGEQRPLNIILNQHVLFSGAPDCGPQKAIEFLPQYLLPGENTLDLSTEKGANYVVDQIIVKTKLKQAAAPIYFFELNQDQLNAVTSGSKKATVYFRFADAVEQKQGELWINGVKTSFDTREISYNSDISQYVLKGSNALEIKPKTSLFILDLEVRIQ